MQAFHDVLNHGLEIDKYDHLEFPGVVPRTFIGPLAIAAMSSPFVLLCNVTGASKMAQQYIARATLGLATAVSFIVFCRAVESGFGGNVKKWLILMSITQFHFMFYMSRPLPNVLALSIVLLALSSWLYQKHRTFIWLSGASIIIFRFDLIMFLGLIAFKELAVGRVGPLRFAFTTIIAGICLLGLTVLVDSYFWRRWLWPEGEVMWFNTVLNKSSEWGVSFIFSRFCSIELAITVKINLDQTSPFLWYFYSVLPRALGATLVLVPIGVYLMRHVTVLLWPALGYVLLFSLLPHKELRFIIYTFPVFNTVAACALAMLWQNKEKSFLRKLLALGSSCLILGNVVITSGFLVVAHNNYPGGAAIKELHRLEADAKDVHVHIDVFTAQTGVTRFGQLRQDWVYNKTENLPPGGLEMQQYTHLLIGQPPSQAPDVLDTYNSTHSVLARIPAFSGISVDKTKFPPVRVHFTDACFILKRLPSKEAQ
ncbi:mannosyltransferase [Plakobranchus ocellatus]|uniref:Mannosyltransferase n=1 Tax=Plakobranchus ocellatus TaxID=259542 RepID=A0AAV3YCM2_9GAST|nr:mannosyltransferase [Plakobranchus ocellatus]